MKLTVGKTGTVKLKNTKYKRTDIEWYSSNPDVAIVDKNGKIKGISSGEAIKWETGDGSLSPEVILHYRLYKPLIYGILKPWAMGFYASL